MINQSGGNNAGDGTLGNQQDEKTVYQIMNEFSTVLNTLTHNDANIIRNLTQFSFNHIKAAKEIVSAIERKIQESSNPRQKLTIIYLLDSIIKNVGRGYVELFSQNIVNTYTQSFKLVDDQIKASLYNLYNLWKERNMVKSNYLDEIQSNLDSEFKRVSLIPKPSSQSISKPHSQPNNNNNMNNMNNMNNNSMNMNMNMNSMNNMNYNNNYNNNQNYNNNMGGNYMQMNKMVSNNVMSNSNSSMDPRFNKGSAPNYPSGNMNNNMNYNNMNFNNMNMNNMNMNNMNMNSMNNYNMNNNMNFNRNFNNNMNNMNNMNYNMSGGNFNNNNNMNNFNNHMNNTNMNINMNMGQDQSTLVSMLDKMTVFIGSSKDQMAIQEVKSFIDDSKIALYQQQYNPQQYFILKQRFISLQSKFDINNTNTNLITASISSDSEQSLSPSNANDTPSGNSNPITSPVPGSSDTNNSVASIQGKQPLSIDSSSDTSSVDNKKGEYDLYEALYLGYPQQCGSCGLRFKDSSKMDKHMDWHWKLNKQLKKRFKQPMSRTWYLDADTWTNYVPDYTQNISEQPSVPFFNDNKPNKKKDTESKPMANLIADDSQPACFVCREKFDRFWDEEAEEWMYRAVEIDPNNNKIIHIKCISSNTNTNNKNISPKLSPSSSVSSEPSTTTTIISSPKKERSHDILELEIQDQQPNKKKFKSEENSSANSSTNNESDNEVDLKDFKEEIASNNIKDL